MNIKTVHTRGMLQILLANQMVKSTVVVLSNVIKSSKASTHKSMQLSI